DGVAARRSYPEPGPSNSGSGAPNDLVAGRLPVGRLGVVNWWWRSSAALSKNEIYLVAWLESRNRRQCEVYPGAARSELLRFLHCEAAPIAGRQNIEGIKGTQKPRLPTWPAVRCRQTLGPRLPDHRSCES